MICGECAWAADNPESAALHGDNPYTGHEACKGLTHCFCQHRKPVEPDERS